MFNENEILERIRQQVSALLGEKVLTVDPRRLAQNFRASILESLERIGGADPSDNLYRKNSNNVTIGFVRESPSK